ncbi:hypothetical protein ACHAQA_001089 [Verticillium albo-atrum]
MADLSDERISQLLSEAEGRLTARQPQRDVRADLPQTIVKSHIQPVEAGTSGGVTRPPRQRLEVRDAHQIISKKEQDDAGPGWFGLPKTDPNDKDLKRDMQLLQMRGTALDPSRHYKKESLKARMPRYAHVGRIVEGPTDYFSARLTRKERKRTLVDELLAAEKASGKFKSKFNDIQGRKSSGKKAFYKKLVAQRRRRN